MNNKIEETKINGLAGIVNTEVLAIDKAKRADYLLGFKKPILEESGQQSVVYPRIYLSLKTFDLRIKYILESGTNRLHVLIAEESILYELNYLAHVMVNLAYTNPNEYSLKTKKHICLFHSLVTSALTDSLDLVKTFEEVKDV